MSVFDRIAEIGVVPVIEIDDASNALGLADALIEGSLCLPPRLRVERQQPERRYG